MSSTSQGYNFDLVCERKNFKADALPLNPSVKNGLKGKTNHRFPTITNNEKILKTQLPFDYSSLDSAEVSTIKQTEVNNQKKECFLKTPNPLHKAA